MGKSQMYMKQRLKMEHKQFNMIIMEDKINIGKCAILDRFNKILQMNKNDFLLVYCKVIIN